MIIVHLCFFLILALSAFVQLNDPDPYFWVVLYLLSAAVPLSAMFKLRVPWFHFVSGMAMCFCLAGIVMTCSGGLEFFARMQEESLLHGMSPSKPYIEEARELFGTLIAFVVVLAYWLGVVRRAKRP